MLLLSTIRSLTMFCFENETPTMNITLKGYTVIRHCIHNMINALGRAKTVSVRETTNIIIIKSATHYVWGNTHGQNDTIVLSYKLQYMYSVYDINTSEPTHYKNVAVYVFLFFLVCDHYVIKQTFVITRKYSQDTLLGHLQLTCKPCKQ